MNFLGLSFLSIFCSQKFIAMASEGNNSFTTSSQNELETSATDSSQDLNETLFGDDVEGATGRRYRFHSRWKVRPLSGYPKPEFQPPPFHLNYETQMNAFAKREFNVTKVEYIEAECFNNYMKIDLRLNGSFHGLIYSTGYAHDPECVYVNGSGRYKYEFYVRLNRCGTMGQSSSDSERRLGVPGESNTQNMNKYMWNSLTVQYNSLIEEEVDEHLKVTCEYGYDYWKTVTFPAFQIEVNTDNPVSFTLNPPQCNMEMRMGYGAAGTRIAGPVTVGDPLTLLVNMKTHNSGFDILVSNCVAHNGAKKKLQLIDSNGCVMNNKLISNFRGFTTLENGHQVTLYAYLKAFRFTGSPALYLECDVQMCHGTCPTQRCYWRRLRRRNVRDTPVVSESLNLVHALEVRHEYDASNTEENAMGETICVRTTGFVTLMTLLLAILTFLALLCTCLCWKIRYIKKADELLTEKCRLPYRLERQ